jgi:hypothetical protein
LALCGGSAVVRDPTIVTVTATAGASGVEQRIAPPEVEEQLIYL